MSLGCLFRRELQDCDSNMGKRDRIVEAIPGRRQSDAVDNFLLKPGETGGGLSPDYSLPERFGNRRA